MCLAMWIRRNMRLASVPSRKGKIDGKSAIDVFTSLSHIGRDRFLNDLKVRAQNIVISQTHNPASPL